MAAAESEAKLRRFYKRIESFPEKSIVGDQIVLIAKRIDRGQAEIKAIEESVIARDRQRYEEMTQKPLVRIFEINEVTP